MAGVRTYVVTEPEGPVYQACEYIVFYCKVMTPGDFTFSHVFYCLSGGIEKVVAQFSPVSDTEISTTQNSCPSYCFNVRACRAWDDLGSTAEDRSLAKLTGQLDYILAGS